MPLRVLIVEDEFLIALEIEDILVSAGHEVAGIAWDRTSALRIAAAGEVDAATMDLRLANGSTGLDVAEELHETFGIRSLFVSAEAGTISRTRTDAFRPLGFVDKAFDARNILDALALHEEDLQPSIAMSP